MRGLVETGALGPGELVHVLEVGSGQGTFALNFVEALAHGCGAPGRALVERLRYVLSDYSPRNLEESIAHPGLARLVEAGTVVPALFDFRRPDELAIPVAAPRKPRRKRARESNGVELTAVFANYVCCVSPQKVVRATPDGLLEKHVRLHVDVEDATEGELVAEALTSGAGLPPPELLERIRETVAWRPLDAGRELASHRAILGAFVKALGDATVNYPHVFLDLLRGLRPRLRRGGAFLVSDFGNPDRAEVQSLTNDRAPVRYGLSLTHDVDFAVFDAFAAHERLGVVRTENGLLDLQTVVLLNAPEVPEALRTSFERTHVRREDGQDLLDLSAAAATLHDAGRHHEAARLYGQCLRIAPRSPQVIYRFGRAFLATNAGGRATLERLARRLRLGRRLDVNRTHDFDTLLAGVYLRLGDADRARRLLERSLRRVESAPKHETLALVYERLGERKLAYESHLRALALEPEGQPAARAREALIRDYLMGEGAPVTWSPRTGRKRT